MRMRRAAELRPLPLVVVALLALGGAWYGVVQKATLLREEKAHRLALQRAAAAYQRDLSALQEIRRQQQMRIDRLVRNLGMLEARLTRLDALGERLVARAGLDASLFDFGAPPALGGVAPLRNLVPEEVDLDLRLQALLDGSDRASSGLSAIDFYLMLRQDEKQARPHLWPSAGGWLSSHFGRRRDPFTGRRAMHFGVDIANRLGANVVAAAPGIVVFSGKVRDFGHMILVDHGYGYRTRYAHLHDTTVRAGDEVSAGQCIGHIGSSGRSTGPHLHYEVHRNGMALNPARYLPRRHG